LILPFAPKYTFENTMGWILIFECNAIIVFFAIDYPTKPIFECNAIIVFFAIDYPTKPDPIDFQAANSMGYRKKQICNAITAT
jgi:hypothetical protein